MNEKSHSQTVVRLVPLHQLGVTKLCLVDNPSMPAQRMQRQEELCEVEAKLVYTVRYRTARVVKRNPVSKKEPTIVAHTFNSPLPHSSGRGMHMQIFDFEHSLVFRVCSRVVRTTERNPVSKKEKKGFDSNQKAA